MINLRKYNFNSNVELIALKKSGRKLCYPPTEKIGIIEVSDYPSLGKLTALRFIEWMQLNPEGVISLPTGKTPEYFIKWTKYFLSHWNEKVIQKELGDLGLDVNKKPKLSTFYFVQIDEFYPMNPAQENSFAHYIETFYFKGFGIDPKKALLIDTWKIGAPVNKNLGDIFVDGKIDLSLRYRNPQNELEQKQSDAVLAMDQFAMFYEEVIKQIGGIGFFLGGIGPDGHIGFNTKGSNHFSTTRLAPINYQTAAAAATDLGGIEISRNKVVVTIGLNTITQNPTSTAIIFAAGAAKAKVISDAVQNEASILYPATALHKLQAARFYLTKGAANLLVERKFFDLKNSKIISDVVCEQILVDTAVQKDKSLENLTSQDLKENYFGQLLFKPDFNFKNAIKKTQESLKEKIAKGLDDFAGSIFLHTAPHHDDIMLGYLPYIVHLVRTPKNSHYFATMTSGFTSVTNGYTLNQLKNVENFLQSGVFDPFIKNCAFDLKDAKNSLNMRNSDIYHYLDGVAANNIEKQKRSESCRLLRNLVKLFNLDLNKKTDINKILDEIERLKKYFEQTYPGKKDIPIVQTIKGMIREWEEELLWGHLGFHSDHIFHLRLGFYTGDIFTQQPEMGRDVKPILHLLEKINPDILTVALDPEGSGPDTHYKVLQAVSQALAEYLKKHPNKKIKIWGYRNVWYRFLSSQANIFAPVSMNAIAILRQSFNTCFGSQRAASFPSHEHDGPFSDLAQKIMVEQYNMLRKCLGQDFFYKNPVPRLRATRGFCFLKSMDPQEFFEESALLKRQMENS